MVLICRPLEVLVIKVVLSVGWRYLQGPCLRNFTVGVVNSCFENSANVQKDCP